MRALAAACAASLLSAACASPRADLALPTAAGRLHAPVRSFLDLRQADLVRQGWDISCGAAALSTILTHHFGDPYSEATIALSILGNTDPERVRARGGFSLLDLKRFAEAVGYTATGYADVSTGDLAASPVPAILPVRIRDFDHFVVFRGRAGGHVLVGDPAFGNLTLRVADFEQMWTSGIAFFVDDPRSAAAAGRAPIAPGALEMVVSDLNYVYRTLQGQTGPPAPLP